MTFFEQQKVARTKSRTLIALFTLAIFLMVIIIYVAIRILFFKYTVGFTSKIWFPPDFWEPTYLFIICGPIIAIIALASAVKIYQLNLGGGTSIAEMLGGRLIQGNTNDQDERRLLNLIEEMAIASGLNVPWVYVIDADRSINAFTAGVRPSEIVITVSRGAMRLLNRDELQAVIAHEFSHIFHGDVRLNIKLMGLLYGILFLGMTGRKIFSLGINTSGSRHRRTDKGHVLPMVAVGLVLMLVGFIGVFFARLIQFAVSRQREFLADASAIQYTRLETGITGALKKIGGLSFGSRLSSPEASLAGHMFFADGLKRGWINLFSSHPPLVERIKRIEPNFQGIYLKIEYQSDSLLNEGEPVANLDRKHPTESIKSSNQTALYNSHPAVETLEGLLALAGTVNTAALTHAQTFINDQPDLVKKLIHDPLGARAILYMCLFDTDENVSKRQLAVIRNYENKEVVAAVNRLHSAKIEFKHQRLSLVELCLPALRQMSRLQFHSLRDTLSRLIKIDDLVKVSEYALYRLVGDHLSRFFDPEAKLQHRPLTADRGLFPTVSMLLAQLSLLTSQNSTEALSAYNEAAKLFGIQDRDLFNSSNFPGASLADFDLSFSLIDAATIKNREAVLSACTAIVMFNHHISSDEYDLIRIIAAKLECPMPLLT